MMGIPFVSVTVAAEPVPDELGRITLGQVELNGEWPTFALPGHEDFDPARARRYAARNVAMTLAGPLAESLYTRCWHQPPGRDGDDEWFAHQVAALCEVATTPKARRAWVDRLRFTTMETLRTPYVWAAVTTLAERLIERGTVSGPEAYMIVSRAMPCEAAERPWRTGSGTQVPVPGRVMAAAI